MKIESTGYRFDSGGWDEFVLAAGGWWR